MEYGQVFAALDRMDIEGRIDATRIDSVLIKKLGLVFDVAKDAFIEKPNSELRLLDFLLMSGVVRRLYERGYEASALWFYKEMKRICGDNEMRQLYNI